MNKSLKNIFKNGVASGIQKILQIAQQLLLIPFFLSYWGAEYYGEWLTITVFPTILNLSNVGLGTAASNSFVLRFIAQDFAGAKRVYRAGFIFVTISILVGCIGGLILIYLLTSNDILSQLSIPLIEAQKVISILILSRLFNFYYPLLESRYLIARKADVAMNVRNLFAFLKIVLFSILLVYGFKMLALALVDLCITVFALLVNYMITINNLNRLKSIKIENILIEFKEILLKGISYMLNPFWQAMFFQGTTLIVRGLLGAESVTLINTARTLSRTVSQLLILVHLSIFPEIQFEFGAKNFGRVQKIIQIALALVGIASLSGVFILGIIGPYFYEIWTQGKLEVPSSVWWLLLIGVIFNTQWWTASVIFRASNQPRILAVTGTVGVVIVLSLSYFLTNTFGLDGMATSMLLMEIIMAIVIIPKTCQIIGLSLKDIYIGGLSGLVDSVNLLKMAYKKEKI
ncbi:MAG: hypothetical protein AAF960_19390 [Bacteroidota bacterium]